MARFIRIMGRLTGHALKSHAVERTLGKAAGYMKSEIRLTDVRLRRSILRQKRTRHFAILGRTVYRLRKNGIDPASDERIDVLSRVLREIDIELERVDEEIKLRRERERAASSPSPGDGGGDR